MAKKLKPGYGKLELLNPKKMKLRDDTWKYGHGWNYILDYSWILEWAAAHPGLIVFDVGCGTSKLWKPLVCELDKDVYGVDRDPSPSVDHLGGFMDIIFDKTPDIIIWASSIEHNDAERMGILCEHSMSLLKPGGMFLATIAISEETHWFEEALQTNLSVEDALKLFGISEIVGNYDNIRGIYRKNPAGLMDNYHARFGRFDEEDPAYIVGGIVKIRR